MQKIIVILLIAFLWMGSQTQSLSGMHCIGLHQMYEQCSVEDHDITPLDFVFEHLLNLELIVNFFEGEHEYVNGDHPHEPFQNTQSISSTLIALLQPARFELEETVLPSGEVTQHFTGKSNSYLSRFCTNIFRPPILS